MDAATRHLVQRLLADVDFLAEQGHLRPYQANSIRTQLKPLTEGSTSTEPATADADADANPPPFSVATSQPAAAAATPTPVYRAPPPPAFQAAQPPTSSPSPSLASAAKSKVPPPPPPAAEQWSSDSKSDAPRQPEKKKDLVKALWAFDASGGDDELRFDVGDTIEVTERVDENWWKGTVVGQPGTKEGLFPANYVEPLIEPERAAATAARVLPPAHSDSQAPQHHWPAPTARFGSSSPAAVISPQPSGYGSGNEKSSGYGAPAYGPGPYGYGAPPPPPADGSVAPNGLQPMDPEEQKKRSDKLKKLGGRVGGAAAGGFGFGIGAGLASNLF